MAKNKQPENITPPSQGWQGGVGYTPADQASDGRSMMVTQLFQEFRSFLPKFDEFRDNTRDRLTRLESETKNINGKVTELPTKEDLSTKLGRNTFFIVFSLGTAIVLGAIIWAAEKISDENHELIDANRDTVTITKETSVNNHD